MGQLCSHVSCLIAELYNVDKIYSKVAECDMSTRYNFNTLL